MTGPTERGARLALLLLQRPHTLDELRALLSLDARQLRRDLAAVRAAAEAAGRRWGERQTYQAEGRGRGDKLVWIDQLTVAPPP